ncbi:MAG: glycosyl hydrolase-related protein [Chloroflexota bacterium]|nr:glycosyl hydrolase-related protein [Chloroflexota bacterium]
MSKDKTLHMIGNAHIDPVWLWQWQEGFQEVKASFRSALDRMREYDDFVFVSSSAAFYEWVEKNDLAMFEEIRGRIEEGRWVVVGGWWIQPDCNIPSCESFVRQGLYGQHYLREKFGITATVGYNVDSFGHHAMLPQILQKSGLESYIFMRPGTHEMGLPGRLFWWESDDGSRVLGFRLPFEYCTPRKELTNHIRRCASELKPPFDELMCFYGVGNHGGGPTRENIENIQHLNDDPDFPRLVFSTPERFFCRVREKEWSIPVVHDELQHHASGCYVVHSGIKRWNRRAENRLIKAEKFSAVAFWETDQPYPDDFKQAWKDVLFNQFHDILAGTSIEAAYDDARNLYGEALSIADRGLNYAIQSLSWKIRIDLEEGMKPIVVFNPHAWASRVNVQLEVGGLSEHAGLVDEEGHSVPMQRMQSHATARGRYRISFIAELPALGYRTYRLLPEAPPDEAEAIEASDQAMENERFRLVFDPETGYITQLYDKQKQFNLLLGPAARPVVMSDTSDTWGHNVFCFNDEVGAFRATSTRLVEHGPVKSVLRVISQYNQSILIQDFTMYRDLDQIDVHVTVDWREQHALLKLQFPINLYFARATYEIPYGHIERPVNGEEEPGQGWFDFSGVAPDTNELSGLSILNDGKYSFDILNKVMSMTVLRSPIYAHHMPIIPDPEAHYSFIDQGVQRFTYSLLPHEGGWEEAGTVRRAAELNQRPITLIETYHPEGTLPQKDSFVSVDQDNIIVSVLKKAEEGDDLILRAYECNQMATDTTIRLPKWCRTIEAHFGPCEIKTFRIPRDREQPVVETNLLEWEEAR